MRNDLIRAILDCGADDLNMLDDAGADMFKVVERMRFEGMELTLNGIMAEVFREGIFRLSEAVKETRKSLEREEQHGILTETDYDRLQKLREYNINPSDDFGYYVNCLDTHLYFNPQSDRDSMYTEEKKAVYKEIFEQELQDMVDYTGFDISW